MKHSKLIIVEGPLENRRRATAEMIVRELQKKGKKVVCVTPQFEAEREKVLEKWREFTENEDEGITYVCSHIFQQEYMCEIADIIRSLNPMILYLEQKGMEERQKLEVNVFEKAKLDCITLGETLTAEEYQALFLSVGWGAPAIEQIQIALKNTPRSYVAKKNGQTIGMLSLLGDFGLHWFVTDVIVHPDYQGKMIGTILLCLAEEYIRTTLHDGWKADISVFSSPAGEHFYTHLGYQACPRQYRGPGMDKEIESA